MRLDVFHAGDGDCLLLSTADGAGAEHHVLVDGGRSGSFQDHARRFLYDLPRLDVVCVSHIDEDHIAGILRMIEDEVAWRVFDFARGLFEAGEGPEPREPGHPRPPAIGEIWHNALFELVGDDLEVEVQGALTTSAALLAGSPREELRDLASHLDDLATGERSALELSRRISDRQLGIPRNRPRGELMVRGEQADDVAVGAMTLRVLGPSRDDVERLRVTWKAWIDANAEALEKLRNELRGDEARIGTLAAGLVTHPLASALGEGVEGITEPNLASLMLLAEENGRTVLLTGDGASAEILEGLAHHGTLDPEGRAHVDVLKIQHHGALANVTEEFVQKITADHYLFCGNGAHHNPELEAVESLALARLEGLEGHDPVGPDRPFKFWFTSSPDTPDLTDARKKHMQDVRDLLQDLRDDHDPNDRFTFEMLDRGRFTLDL